MSPKLVSIAIVIACFTAVSCAPLYYGYLPGGSYKLLPPTKQVNLSGQCFALKIIDNRYRNMDIACSDLLLDRETELEGHTGIEFFERYATHVIEGAGGRVDPGCPETLALSLEGLSFALEGIAHIIPHGLVQFTASTSHLRKTYCTDITDQDADSPIGRYALGTRKYASRSMISGALRRTLEHVADDLAK